MNDRGFGLRVRRLREERGISREELCQDEVELSVRQLNRIEGGSSKPTFSKMTYIANRLGVTLYELMPDYVSLPTRYTKLKYDIIRTAIYGDAGLVEKRDKALTEIYDSYYKELPEEEKLAMDVIQSRIDVFETASTDFGKDLLDDYFEQVYHKNEYELNDLLIIHLFIMHTKLQTDDKENFQIFLSLLPKLSKQIEILAPDSLFVLRDVLFSAIVVLGRRKEYLWIPNLLTDIELIMDISHDYQKKPILNLFRWKYELFVNRDQQQAQQFYEEGVMFARMINNGHLVQRLEDEWQLDNQ